MDGQVWAGSRPVTLDQLADEVREWRESNQEARVVIRADRGNRYGLVKQVMKVCRDAGIADIIFSSLQPGGEG